MSHKTVPAVYREAVHEYLTVRHVRTSQDLERVNPVGEIDLYTAHLLRDALANADDVPNLLVDLSQVHFLALVGVQELLSTMARRTAAGRRLVVVAGSPAVQRVLSLTNAAADLDIYLTTRGALSALSAPVS